MLSFCYLKADPVLIGLAYNEKHAGCCGAGKNTNCGLYDCCDSDSDSDEGYCVEENCCCTHSGASLICPLSCHGLINSFKNLGTYISNTSIAQYMTLSAKALDKKIRISEELIGHFAPLIFDADSHLLAKLDPEQALALYYVNELGFRMLVEKHEFSSTTYHCSKIFGAHRHGQKPKTKIPWFF